jgi:hypothetical protein
MPSTVSTLPAALDALLQALGLALPDKVQLIDGQPIRTDPDIIAIGFNGEPETEMITTTRRRADRGGRSDSETHDISCIASSWRGDTDPKLVRDRAFELIDLVAAELARDRTLDRTVARAYLTVSGVAPVQTTKGAMCTVRFTIRIDAFT